uniref:hypothetical protein n=1 Tax=Hassallia byssoidea TaxID=482630 RepID=UPI000584E1F6|nr:hypothetical protein [Hassalia byssoidea]
MPDYKTEQDQVEHFKNWIRTRFIAECDFQNLPCFEAFAWSIALREMSQSLTHAIVPFQRRGGKS